MTPDTETQKDERCPDSEQNNNDGKSNQSQHGLVVTGLAALQEGDLVDAIALADILNVSTRTVRRMISQGELPEGFKLGCRKMWSVGILRRFFTGQADRKAEAAEKLAAQLTI